MLQTQKRAIGLFFAGRKIGDRSFGRPLYQTRIFRSANAGRLLPCVAGVDNVFRQVERLNRGRHVAELCQCARGLELLVLYYRLRGRRCC